MINSTNSKFIKIKQNCGFSLVETLISIAILGVVISGFLAVQSKLSSSAHSTKVKQNLLGLRHFIRTNFSCEDTLEKNGSFQRNEGFLSSQSCPNTNPISGSVIAYNYDAREMMGHKPIANIGMFKVRSECIEETTRNPQVKKPLFRFWATALDSNGKPLKNPIDSSKLLDEYDIFDGMTIGCQMPDTPGVPRPGGGCSIALRDRNGSLTSNMAAGGFTAPLNAGYNYSFDLHSPFDAGRPDNGKPYFWRISFVNKSPHETGGPQTAGTISSTPFDLASASVEMPATNPISSMPECVPDPSDPVSKARVAINPNCKFWGEKVMHSSFTPPQRWFDTQVDMVAKALDKNKMLISECRFTITLYDPLVLTWQPTHLDPQPLIQSMVDFDFDNSGQKRRTGWVFGNNSVYLTLDLNGNSRVDSGAELFGDFTLLRDGTKAKNGFEALAQYDTDKNGHIDSADEVFKRLRLWFDENGDGISEPWELFSLSEAEVTSIGLTYKTVTNPPPGDTVLARYGYEGVFRGGGICKGSGCRIYDVFFGFNEPSQLD